MARTEIKLGKSRVKSPEEIAFYQDFMDAWNLLKSRKIDPTSEDAEALLTQAISTAGQLHKGLSPLTGTRGLRLKP